MSQIVERFEAAVETLVGEGPVKHRLGRAYTEFLEDLRPVDLPIPGNGDLGELHSALHSEAPVGNIGAVTASIHKMSPAEAWWHARTILRVYTELLAMGRGARPEGESALEPAGESGDARESAPAAIRPPRILAGGA